MLEAVLLNTPEEHTNSHVKNRVDTHLNTL